MPSPSRPDPSRAELFPLTMWSALRDAQGGSESEIIKGLERLASAYWRPLYVFLRKRGYPHEKAADHVQGFFEYLLTGEVLRKAQPGQGRFRNFLLVVFRRWLDDGQRKELAIKRGGKADHLPFDELDTTGLDLPEGDEKSPEEAFDRKWALSLVQRSLSALEDEWSGKLELFGALKCGLEGTGGTEPYAVIAQRLRMTEGAVKTAAYELRKSFGAQVRREVRSTVASDQEVEEELRYLVQLLGR